MPEPVGGHVDSAHTLDAFHYHSRHVAFRHLAFGGIGVAKRHERHAMVCVDRRHNLRVVGSLHSKRCASVERLSESHDAPLAGVERSQFHSVFVGFRTRVYQEEAVVVVSARLAEFLSQAHLQRVVDRVGVEHQFLRLTFYRVDIVRMAVSNAYHGVAAVEVKIFCAFAVVDVAAFAAHNLDIEQRIYIKKIHRR